MFIVSCNDDDASVPETTYENFTRFSDGTASYEISEADASSISLPIVINDYATSDVTVNLQISGSDGAYEILSGSANGVTIEAGTRMAMLQIRPVDNDEFNDPNNQITITITGVSGSDAVLAEDAAAGYLTKTITFKDNECMPGPRNNWIGPLAIEDVGFGFVAGSGAITNDDCDALLVTGNLPNSSLGLEPTFIFKLNPNNNTITCAPQSYGSSFYEATGTYDTATNTIDVYYLYKSSTGSLFWDGTNIIKPE